MSEAGLAPDAQEAATVDVSLKKVSQRIATQEELEDFIKAKDRRISERLFGIITEVAVRGILRYEWDSFKILVERLILARLNEFPEPKDVEVGPSPKVPHSEFISSSIDTLHNLLSNLEGYPFTIKRICEVLVSPGEQYSRAEAMVWALAKCLKVTSTISKTVNPPERSFLDTVDYEMKAENGTEGRDRAHSMQSNGGVAESPMGSVKDDRNVDSSAPSNVARESDGNGLVGSVFTRNALMYNSNVSLAEYQTHKASNTEKLVQMHELVPHDIHQLKEQHLLKACSEQNIEQHSIEESPQKKCRIGVDE